MNQRERIFTAFAHKQPDRTPCFEYILLSPVADAVLGRPYEDFGGIDDRWIARAHEIGFETALRQYAKDRIELALRLGHDMLYCVPNPSASAVENYAPGKEEILSHDVDIYVDPVEVVLRRNEETLEKLSRPEDESIYLVYSYLKEEMERQGVDLPIYSPAFSHGIWDNVELMQTLLLDEDAAHEHFSTCTKVCINYADKMMNLGIDMIGVGGDFAGNQPLISPECYRKFILPELRICTDYIHSRGRLAVNASDGNLWSVIDDFLIGSGVDAYGEIDDKAGMKLSQLKEKYGDRITFFGNIDCGLVLSYDTPEEIAAQTVKCIEDGWGGGHVFTASNAISSSVPLSNYLAMVNAYRAYFRLPPVKVE